MDSLNNPAARLLALIRVGIKQPKNKPAAEIWANILSTPIENKSLLLRRIGFVMALPMKIRQNIEQIDSVDLDLYLKWLPKVENAFSLMNFQIEWNQFINKFDEAVIYGMEICSDILSRMRPENVVNEKLLAELWSEIDSLISKIEESDLDVPLKDFVFAHLQKIKNALEEYKIRGIKPLEDQFCSTIGTVVLDPQIYKRCKESKFGSKFWNAMRNLAILVTITVGSIQIGNDVVPLLSDLNASTKIENTITDVPAEHNSKSEEADNAIVET